MSNVLSPIVARYSLFFTLALSDSSRMAKSKCPRQEVHERVFQAQGRFQTRYHADATRKLRALIRNVSSSSTSTQCSQSSTSSSTSSTSTATSLSSSTDTVCNSCCQSCSPTSSIQYLSSFPIDEKDSKCSNQKCLGVGPRETASAAAMTLPSPPPSPPFNSTKGQDLLPATSSPSSMPSSEVRSQPKTRSTRTKAEKIAQRRRRSRIASIATLLSIALTVIFLSLLQNRRQGLRKKNRPSSQRPQSPLHLSQQDQAHLDHCTASSSTPPNHQHLSKLKSCNSSGEKRRRHNSIPQIMSTSALDAMATDNAPSGQTNDAFVATWLERQDLPEKEEQSSWEDADDIPTEELSFLIGCDVMDSSSKLDPDEEFSYPLEQQYSSGHLYYTSPSQIPSYRHSISFDTTSTRLDDHISYSDPTDQYQMFGQYIDPAQQMQQYRLQHYPYVDHHVRRQISVPPLDNEPSSSFVYGPPIRSAHELAWERHNYYQRLQQEEEELALKMRQERLQRQEQQRQTQQDSYVVRAGSVNRLASPSLLSRETSRALGICRSNTLLGAAAAKNMSSVEKNVVIRPAMFLTKVNNGETTMNADYSTTSANNIGLTTSQTMPVETVTPAAPTLSRKKTLKDHLSPSLRSLARHCSSRFGGGSSGTRPNSFLSPKSGPILEHPQEEERSRTPSSRPASPVLDSTRMTDFKPLRAGPETTEILKQSQQQQQQQQQKQQQEQQPSQQRCPTPTGERVRAHRRRTLFRSNTTQAPSSTLMSTMAPDHGQTRNRADTLPNRKNNSMRLANGRRRDISTFFSDVTPENVDDASRATTTAPETLRRHMSTPVLPIRTAESRPSSPDLQAPNGEEGEEEEYGLTLRKQIVSIFSLGRKSSSSKKTKNATPAMSVSPSSHCLSPLAVEAQETLPDLFNQQQTMNSREEKEDDYGYYEEEEGQIGQKMMEDHIAFMLVPKSRYEFQPLLVQ